MARDRSARADASSRPRHLKGFKSRTPYPRENRGLARALGAYYEYTELIHRPLSFRRLRPGLAEAPVEDAVRDGLFPGQQGPEVVGLLLRPDDGPHLEDELHTAGSHCFVDNVGEILDSGRCLVHDQGAREVPGTEGD